MLLPEYQSNDVENCLISLPICSLIGHSFPWIWGNFLQKAPSETSKMSANDEPNPFVFLPNNDDTHVYPCNLSPWENGIPLNEGEGTAYSYNYVVNLTLTEQGQIL